jgi:hypothetical protein
MSQVGAQVEFHKVLRENFQCPHDCKSFPSDNAEAHIPVLLPDDDGMTGGCQIL